MNNYVVRVICKTFEGISPLAKKYNQIPVNKEGLWVFDVPERDLLSVRNSDGGVSFFDRVNGRPFVVDVEHSEALDNIRQQYLITAENSVRATHFGVRV